MSWSWSLLRCILFTLLVHRAQTNQASVRCDSVAVPHSAALHQTADQQTAKPKVAVLYSGLTCRKTKPPHDFSAGIWDNNRAMVIEPLEAIASVSIFGRLATSKCDAAVRAALPWTELYLANFTQDKNGDDRRAKAVTQFAPWNDYAYIIHLRADICFHIPITSMQNFSFSRILVPHFEKARFTPAAKCGVQEILAGKRDLPHVGDAFLGYPGFLATSFMKVGPMLMGRGGMQTLVRLVRRCRVEFGIDDFAVSATDACYNTRSHVTHPTYNLYSLPHGHAAQMCRIGCDTPGCEERRMSKLQGSAGAPT